MLPVVQLWPCRMYTIYILLLLYFDEEHPILLLAFFILLVFSSIGWNEEVD